MEKNGNDLFILAEYSFVHIKSNDTFYVLLTHVFHTKSNRYIGAVLFQAACIISLPSVSLLNEKNYILLNRDVDVIHS